MAAGLAWVWPRACGLDNGRLLRSRGEISMPNARIAGRVCGLWLLAVEGSRGGGVVGTFLCRVVEGKKKGRSRRQIDHRPLTTPSRSSISTRLVAFEICENAPSAN